MRTIPFAFFINHNQLIGASRAVEQIASRTFPKHFI